MQSNLEKLEEWPGQPGVQMAAWISVDVGTVSGANWLSSCPEEKDLELRADHLRRRYT